MVTKNILFITGSRADFGKMKPLMRQVESASDFEARIFATGMHMLARYGSTVNEIRKTGFSNIFTHINQDATFNSRMDLILATTIEGLGHYVQEFPPDLIVVHGDRIEALAGAIVGALENILVAHIEGGELSGTVDELIRHAVTKLSHIHFVANDEAARRLKQLGELDQSIFVIGSPDIDIMLSDELPSLGDAKAWYDISFSNYLLFIYHPVTTQLSQLRGNIGACVDALLASELNYIVIYPNNDKGSDCILEAYERLRGSPRFKLCPSLRFEYFLTLLKHAAAIVGNSSAGIREAPVYGVPTINIGTRQMNRSPADSIVRLSEDRDAILEALRRIPASVPPSFHFGRGTSSKLFMESLRGEQLWQTQPQKQFRDLPSP